MIKTIHRWICITGIWIVPAVDGMYLAYCCAGYAVPSGEHLQTITTLAVCATLLNLLINLATYANGKRDYHLLDALDYRNDPYMRPKKRAAAMRPKVNPALLKKEPTGIVLGRQGQWYVCNDPAAGGAHHTMILGVTGCGKTSTVVLDTILSNPGTAIFAIDIKGELHAKGTRPGEKDILAAGPGKGRDLYGYDPLYAIRQRPENLALVTETMREITLSLIPINAKTQNPFWEMSARDLLNALLLFHFKQGVHNLIDIVDEITAEPITDIIERVYQESEDGTVEKKLISRYVGMAEETLSGVNAQMMAAISLLISDEAVRYMLRDNPLRVTPVMLDEGKSIYLKIEEYRLESYACLVQLIFNQVVSCLERRKEDGKPVILIVDELARILSAGKLAKLENGLETLRSRNVSLMLVSQSVEALERAYSKADIESMMNNCPYKVILSATSKETQDAVIRWAGKYEERRYSRGISGARRSSNINFVEENIVQAAELMTLPEQGECIIISPYGYNRVKKAPYYQDKILAKRANEIKRLRQAERK